VERESKCGAYYNLHRIKLKKAMGLQQITKTFTMCEFLNRCTGHRVDRGAFGANAQIKTNCWGRCAECAEKHSEFVHMLERYPCGLKNQCTFCYTVGKKISDEICWHRGRPRVQRYNNAPTKP
jgi:hypothetical protein